MTDSKDAPFFKNDAEFWSFQGKNGVNHDAQLLILLGYQNRALPGLM